MSALNSAIADYYTYNINQKQAAARHRVPYSTLNHRIRGRPTRGPLRSQLLSQFEEVCLVNLILDLQKQGQPASHLVVRRYTTLLLRSRGIDSVPGKNWVTRFWKRHPQLGSCNAQSQLWEKLTSLTDEGIENFFDHFESIATREDIPPSRWINMDEKGTQLGTPSSDRVLFSKTVGPPVALLSSTSTWVTIIESCSATGEALPPVVIHIGQEPRTSWFESPDDMEASWLYDFSKKGWSDSDIAVKWLRLVLIPWLDGEKCLLFLDSHPTHIGSEFVALARLHHIYMVLIPPAATHVLQPLDVGTFAHLDRHYRWAMRDRMYVDGTPIRRADFNAAYRLARPRAMTKQYITAGWSKSGLFPTNRDRVECRHIDH